MKLRIRVQKTWVLKNSTWWVLLGLSRVFYFNVHCAVLDAIHNHIK